MKGTQLTEGRTPQQLPKGVVSEDVKLARESESAGVALARHRWNWTKNPDNSERVSIRDYARQVGVSHAAIAYQVKAYEMSSVNSTVDTYWEALERVRMSQERQIAIEAVAAAFGNGDPLTFAYTRKSYGPVIDEVRNATEREAEKREERGESFPAEERSEYAHKVALAKRHSSDRDQRERDDRQSRHSRMFMQFDSHLTRVRREAKEALDIALDVKFTDEEVELAERQHEATIGLLRLVGLALTGDSGTDWDAELAALEERRNNG